MTVQSVYHVEGMTCSHCVHAVQEEISSLPGVLGVTIDLHAGGASDVLVTSQAGLAREDVAAAVDEAGYALV